MRAILLSILLIVSCARAAAVAPDAAVLTDRSGAPAVVRELAAAAPFTVLVFIAEGCPCLDAHLDRLRALAAEYGPRGVRFLAVDAEVSASKARAAAAEKRLALPVWIDHGARFAEAVGAEYATFTVVLDRGGAVRYRGGIDSDKRKLHDDATPYLRDALDDLLAGRAVRRTEGRALGCVLRKW